MQLLTVTVALGSCTSTDATSPVQLDGVVPETGFVGVRTSVQIRGTGFRVPIVTSVSGQPPPTEELEITLGGVALESVVLRSPSLIDADVPAALAVGRHDLVLRLQSGTEARKADAYEVFDEQFTGMGCQTGSDCSDPCHSLYACIDGQCVVGEIDYVVDASCGVGYCRSTNKPSSCVLGEETLCQAGAPLSEGPQLDPSCTDHVDNDCDGLTDDDDPGCGGINMPPVAAFAVRPGAGVPSTSFVFDAAATIDDDPHSSLHFYWDWQSDGTDDVDGLGLTGPANVFSAVGLHQISLRVEDTAGLVAYFVSHVVVADAADVVIVTTAADEDDVGESATPPHLGTGLSLREALSLASATVGRQTIAFQGAMTILLASLLPDLDDTAGVDIAGEPGVVLDAQFTVSRGLLLSAANNRILHLSIQSVPRVDIDNCGIGIQVSSDDNLIHHTVVEDVGDPAPCSSRSEGIVVTGSNNILDENVVTRVAGVGFRITGNSNLLTANRIHANDDSGILMNSNAVATTFERNLIYENGGAGVSVGSATSGTILRHNTIHSNAGSALQAINTAFADVRDNIFSWNGEFGIDDGAGTTFLTLDYNNYVGNTLGTCGGCTTGPGSLTEDPLYANPGAGDLRLLPGSLCIDAGVDVGVDVNGAEFGNYNSTAPDVGAWEAP